LRAFRFFVNLAFKKTDFYSPDRLTDFKLGEKAEHVTPLSSLNGTERPVLWRLCNCETLYSSHKQQLIIIRHVRHYALSTFWENDLINIHIGPTLVGLGR